MRGISTAFDVHGALVGPGAFVPINELSKKGWRNKKEKEKCDGPCTNGCFSFEPLPSSALSGSAATPSASARMTGRLTMTVMRIVVIMVIGN